MYFPKPNLLSLPFNVSGVIFQLLVDNSGYQTKTISEYLRCAIRDVLVLRATCRTMYNRVDDSFLLVPFGTSMYGSLLYKMEVIRRMKFRNWKFSKFVFFKTDKNDETQQKLKDGQPNSYEIFAALCSFVNRKAMVVCVSSDKPIRRRSLTDNFDLHKHDSDEFKRAAILKLFSLQFFNIEMSIDFRPMSAEGSGISDIIANLDSYMFSVKSVKFNTGEISIPDVIRNSIQKGKVTEFIVTPLDYENLDVPGGSFGSLVSQFSFLDMKYITKFALHKVSYSDEPYKLLCQLKTMFPHMLIFEFFLLKTEDMSLDDRLYCEDFLPEKCTIVKCNFTALRLLYSGTPIKDLYLFIDKITVRNHLIGRSLPNLFTFITLLQSDLSLLNLVFEYSLSPFSFQVLESFLQTQKCLDVVSVRGRQPQRTNFLLSLPWPAEESEELARRNAMVLNQTGLQLLVIDEIEIKLTSSVDEKILDLINHLDLNHEWEIRRKAPYSSECL